MKNRLTKKQKVIEQILDGKPVDWVRRHEDVSARTIRKWLVEFAQSGRDEALVTRPRPMTRSYPLSAKQIKWLQHVLVSKCPEDLGLKKKLWNGILFQKLIKQWFGIEEMNTRSYSLLNDLGFRFSNPIPFLLTPQVVDICSEAKVNGEQIVYVGSYSLEKSFEVIPSLNPDGAATTVPKLVTKHSEQVVFSFNHSKKGNRFLVYAKPLSEEVAKDFFDRFASDFPVPVCVFVSPDTFFSSKTVVSYVQKNFEQIKIFRLPKKT